MKSKYPAEWRTQSAWKKRFYARYMKWLERIGYAVVALVLGAFVFAFNYRVDDVISADKVPIMASHVSVQLKEPVVVVQSLAANFSDVEAGKPILEVVKGESQIDQYLAWTAMERSGIVHNLVRPKTETLLAAQAGVFVFDEALLGNRLEPDTELAQLRDYSQLLVSAKLGGQGVANAKAGGVATLKSLSVSSASGVLLRGDTGTGPVVSGRLVGAGTVEKLSVELMDMPLQVRDDIPLQVSGISKLEVDSQMVLKEGGSGEGVQVDPAASTILKAEVLSGEHTATIQFANLPSSIQERVNRVIEEAVGDRVVTDLAGNPRTIQSVGGLNTVFQVTAVPGAGKSGMELVSGTAISRNFEAQLKIQSPPDYLMKAVRNADAEGQTVTVKVELKTGDRAIATLLLKRS
jgi:hypothetical protein